MRPRPREIFDLLVLLDLEGVGGGLPGQAFINGVLVVPEPSIVMLATIGVLALLGRYGVTWLRAAG